MDFLTKLLFLTCHVVYACHHRDDIFTLRLLNFLFICVFSVFVNMHDLCIDTGAMHIHKYTMYFCVGTVRDCNKWQSQVMSLYNLTG